MNYASKVFQLKKKRNRNERTERKFLYTLNKIFMVELKISGHFKLNYVVYTGVTDY